MKEEDIYTWPNDNFPFKCLVDGRNARVFFLSDITHNYKWFKKAATFFRETDFFFVAFGWYFSEALAYQSKEIFKWLDLNPDQFYLLFNSYEEQENGIKYGFKGEVISNNAWLDERNYKISKRPIKYNALYIARPVAFKKHRLLAGVENLALVAGGKSYGSPGARLPPSLNDSEKFLSKKEISEICGESKCGVILSKEEGACFASSEYLLSGLPVVSTSSRGGRDLWYSKNNCIYVEANNESVKEGVKRVSMQRWDPELIRDLHILQSHSYRRRFHQKLKAILDERGEVQEPSLSLPEGGVNWYCNPGSNCIPNIAEVLHQVSGGHLGIKRVDENWRGN